MKLRNRLVAAGLGSLLVLGTTAGCAAVEVSPPVSSCHTYSAPSKFGKFTIQQRAAHHAIQWGAYPAGKYAGTHYLVNVYADGHRVDKKSQNYAPHGSVSATYTTKYSKKILKISGTVTAGKKTALVFNMQCKIM